MLKEDSEAFSIHSVMPPQIHFFFFYPLILNDGYYDNLYQ